jgi:multifunctional beta-oxidation protein
MILVAHSRARGIPLKYGHLILTIVDPNTYPACEDPLTDTTS